MKSITKMSRFPGLITAISLIAVILSMSVISADVITQEAGIEADGNQASNDSDKLGSTMAGNGIQAASQGLTYTEYNATQKGGYVSSGVGMRNRGWGTILIQDIPIGSTVTKAYLFWSVISPPGVTTAPASYANGKFNGNSITGTLMGSATQPCWNGGLLFGYRCDVTTLVIGNNVYHLTDFATGTRWGTDPWTYNYFPAFEGASLVVVYSNPKYPMTNVQIKSGVDYVAGSTSTTTFSFTGSSLPVARSTFIVADGQNNFTENVYFNDILLSATFCDGIDRQNGINFLYGNLQDTNTAYVKVNPSSASATAKIVATGDCLVWLAQVFSIYDGNVDTDGDALKDYWEVYGYDNNGDGVVDVNLPGLGANPYKKDIFVEVDYMAAGTGETVSHRPHADVVTKAVSTFANAPFANNPNGSSGISIHVEIGNQVAHDNDLNPVWTEFDVIKAANFPAARQHTHHYCLFAHMYSGGTSSGLSRGIPASDFIVTLGGWSSNPGTADQQVGTFIHELGHNLGLMHGGNDHTNYKPNYLSVMNYFFQMTGVYRSGVWGNFDYQRIASFSLNENSLTEADGIGAVSAGYGTKWYQGTGGTVRTTTVHKPIDWNWNGANTNTGVSLDINNDGSKTTLNSQNNWQNIIYDGGSIPGVTGGAPQTVMPAKMPPCLTAEEYEKYLKPLK